MIRKAAMLVIGMALVMSTVYADPAKVTGGGNIAKGENLAFSLSCGDGPNNLVFNSPYGDFRLDTAASKCTPDASGSITSISGTGTGTWNKASSVTVTYTFTRDTKGGTIVSLSFPEVPLEVMNIGLPGIQFHS